MQSPWTFGFAEKKSPQRQTVVKRKVFICRKKSTVYVDRHMSKLRGKVPESHTCGSLNHLHGHFFQVFFGHDHFDLPGSQTLFGISQDPPICRQASLRQDRFYRRGLWVERLLTSLPFDLQREFLHFQKGLLTLRMRNMWSGYSQTSPLNCPAVLI